MPEELELDIQVAEESPACDGLSSPDVLVGAGAEQAASAVMAVLGGDDLHARAAAAGIDPLRLRHWCDLFVDGGRLRLDGHLTENELDGRFLPIAARTYLSCLDAIDAQADGLEGDDPTADGEGPGRAGPSAR